MYNDLRVFINEFLDFLTVKEMKNKWRNIKDNFFKFLNRGKSGDPALKTKKYVYADALQFLLTTVEKRKTSGNIDGNFEEDSNGAKEEDENVDDKEQREQSELKSKTRLLKPSQSTSYQRNITPFQRELLKKLNNDTNNQEDADKSFLLSLLPDYKKLNDDKKMDFRLLTLQFFKNRQQNKNVHHPPMNLFSEAYFRPQMAINYAQTDRSYPVNPSLHFQPPPSPTPSPSMMQRPFPAQTPSPSSTQSPPPIDASQFCLQMYDNEYPH